MTLHFPCSLLDWIKQLDVAVDAKEAQIERWAREDQAASRLMTIPGVGACTALTVQLILGPVETFSYRQASGQLCGAGLF
ncbi:MAG TPA: hypothetical protein VGQ81_02830 [Acidobacteriota bacterium]|jgi:transposase|nr:hypothetical protein [Acidobacteriota bacterium]